MADLLVWDNKGADNDANVPGNYSLGYGGGAAGSIDIDDNLEWSDDESSDNATATANLEAGSIDLAPSGKTAYSGIVNDGGYELKFNGDILIPIIANLITSTGIWTAKATADIKNSHWTNAFAQFNTDDAITLTLIDSIRAKKVIIGNTIINKTTEEYFKINMIANDFWVQHASAVVNANINFQYVGNFSNTAAVDNGNNILGFTTTATYTATFNGDITCGDLKIFSETATNYMKLICGGNLNITNILLGWDNADERGYIDLGAGTHVISTDIKKFGNSTNNQAILNDCAIALGGTFDGTNITVTGNGAVITGGVIQNVIANKKDAINAKASTSGGNNLGVVFVDTLQPSLMSF